MRVLNYDNSYEGLLENSKCCAERGDVVEMAKWLITAAKKSQLSYADSQSVFDIYWEQGVFRELGRMDFQSLEPYTKESQKFFLCLDASKDWRLELFNVRTEDFLKRFKRDYPFITARGINRATFFASPNS